MSLLILLFTLNVFAVSDQSTEIFNACDEKLERIRLADTLTANEREHLRKLFEEKPRGADVFELGHQLSLTGSNAEAKSIGQYLMTRAYQREKLPHVAYEKMTQLIASPIVTGDSLVGRFAALECVLELQKKIPTFGIDQDVSKRLIEILNTRLAEINPRDKARLIRALMIRTKTLANTRDDKEVESLLKSLEQSPSHRLYADALLTHSRGQYAKTLPLWEKLIDKNELPSDFVQDRDVILLLYARSLFENKEYLRSSELLRTMPRDSNYLSQAFSDMAWGFLQGGQKREAIGTAINLQKSLLTRTFTPEALLVSSIALYELCQYARALQSTVLFRKKYLPIYIWYERLTPEQKAKPYGVLTSALRKKTQIPNLVMLEWLRSPEYRALQTEANILFEEKRSAYRAHGERLNARAGSTWVRAWKEPLPRFYNNIVLKQRAIALRMNQVLDTLTKRMRSQIARMNENVQLLEIEIYDSAGEDMVWRNVNPDYQKWVSEQPPEKRPKNLYWEWGQIAVDHKKVDEVWEDELGWTLGNVSDECGQKKNFREALTVQPTPQPEPSPQESSPAPGASPVPEDKE